MLSRQVHKRITNRQRYQGHHISELKEESLKDIIQRFNIQNNNLSKKERYKPLKNHIHNPNLATKDHISTKVQITMIPNQKCLISKKTNQKSRITRSWSKPLTFF